MISRRLVLASPMALAGCASLSNPDLPFSQKVARIARDVNILVVGLQTAVDQLAANPAIGFTPALRDTCQTALAGLQSAAVALSKTTTEQDAQPLVLKLTSYVNMIIGAVSIIPGLPGPVSGALAAASIMLPVIQIAVGFAVPIPPPASVDSARKTLQ